MDDIKRAYTLFHDETRTVQFLQEYSKEFLFNEEEEEEEEEDNEDEASKTGSASGDAEVADAANDNQMETS